MTTSPDLLAPLQAKLLLSPWNQSRDAAGTPYPFQGASGKNASSTPEPLEPERDVSMIVIQFIYAIVCLIGLIGNSMVIFVILRYAKMKTATNIYILNLAIADELFMLSVPFLAASAALQHWPFGSGMCRTVLSVDGINMFTSVFCLTVLSVDRYVAVVHPLRAARYRRPTVAKMINICVWIVSLLVISPILIFADTESSKNGVVVCNLMWPQPTWSTVFVIYTFLLGFFLPVVAICLCYVLIIVKMRAVALKAGWQQRKKSEKKITRMVLMVVTVFVICWMPFYIVQLLNLFLPHMDSTINHVSIILSYANSCANPILYGFFSDNFKRSFQRIVCFRWLENGTDEPVDYYATALKSKMCNNHHHPLDFQQEPLQSDPCYKHGTITRTTTL